MSTRETLKGRMTKDSVSLLPCFYFVELPILVSSVVSLYFLELTDIFKPVRWGFSCHDRSLSLPYVDPTHEVVPFLMLLILAFAAPTITIMIGEGILFCCLSRKHSGPGAEVDINAAGCNFNSYIRRSVRFVGVHAFGLCATALITDIIQLATGYHAPYFLTVCKPNYTHLNTSCDKNTFIIEDICSGADSAILNAGRKSFPSQHATLASFAAVYISMYFNSTLTDSSKLLKPLLVFSFIICAIICGLTRIIQHKNHAVDVYLGFLLGGAVAVYLGLYAVGNFQASEEGLIREVWERCLPRPGPEMCQAGAAHHHPHPHHLHHHLPAKSCAATGEGLPPGHAPGILHRSLQPRDTGSLASVKRASADVETLGPHVSLGREGMVTFSHTLPRAHTPALDDAARRNATIHTSMDCSRSKQLLSQWKSKNESRKLSLQGNDPCVGQSPPGGMEMRSNSEPSTVGINGEHQGPMASQCYKLTTGSSTLPSNASGITGGARVSIQSRPGSSQLVHIPEEAQENAGTSSPHSASTCARDRWMKGMERSASVTATAPGCRTSGQPRIMQVIAMSKQQGLLPTGSQSFDSSELSCSGNIHYKAMMEQEAGAGQAGTGPIVRVEAHPEVGRPLAQPSPSNGSAPWMWRSQSSLRQSFELNDLNRDSESSDGGAQKDGFSSTERRRSNSSAPIPVTVPTVPTVSGVSTISNSTADHHLHQSISTIRVTPMDGGDPASECLSAAPSRDSTLRRKGNVVLIPERGNCLDNTRNVFYKGTPSTPTPKD